VNAVLLTSGFNHELTIQQVRHQIGTDVTTPTRTINLLILDSRRMEPECFEAACDKIVLMRKTFGLHYGVLVCNAPTLQLTVAAIRCGLRDVIYQYITATRLRAIISASNPNVRISIKEFNALASFLRTFSGSADTTNPVADIARREEEIARRSNELNNLERKLAAEKDAVENRDRELRERTRRLDRQFALMQTDGDIGTSASSTTALQSAELQSLSRKLEQRSAELDFREKLLLEMETVFNTTPEIPTRKNPLG
jgi:hypothetical protein